MFSGIDLYSDTMTKPTEEMKRAMMNAPVGDEQKGEDPTTKKFEEEMAALTGKSAAMFFPSATLANQIAVKLHCAPGEEVIGAEICHIFGSEGGGIAFHAGAQARPIPGTTGMFDGETLKRYVRDVDIPQSPISRLVVVENTINFGGAAVWPEDRLSSVIGAAKSLGLKTHLDGARLFNASVKSGRKIKDLSNGFDSVTICFSKGLGCATGAILAFDVALWPRVRRLKQVFGGAMRQSGILSAACLYALEHHIPQLALDHENCALLASLFRKIKGINVENPEPETNMIFFSVDEKVMDPDGFLNRCLEEKLRFSEIARNRFRAVTHRDVSRGEIEEAGERLKRVMGR